MKNLWVFAVIFVLCVTYITHKVQDEYTKACASAESIRVEVLDAIENSTEAVKSFRATSDSIRETIADIKDRLVRIESAQLALASSQPKAAANIAKPRIVMHSGDGCGPCRDWIAKSMPSWEQQGWDVEVVKEIDSSRGWPWFEVYLANGKRFEVDGPLTLETYDKALSSAK